MSFERGRVNKGLVAHGAPVAPLPVVYCPHVNLQVAPPREHKIAHSAGPVGLGAVNLPEVVAGRVDHGTTSCTGILSLVFSFLVVGKLSPGRITERASSTSVHLERSLL